MAKVGVDNDGGVVFDGKSLSADLQPTVMFDGTNYVSRPLSCGDLVYQQLTCGYAPYFSFAASGGKRLTYIQKCSACTPWTVRLNDELLGSVRKAGPCDNGTMYCLCSACICKEVAMVNFFGKEGNKFGTVRMYDGLLKKCCGPCGEKCGVITELIGRCMDCCAFVGNMNSIVISENIYSEDMSNTDPIAQIHEVLVIEMPQPCVFTRRSIRQSVKASKSFGDQDIVPVASLLPMMQQGLSSNPCGCCSAPLLPAATGSACDCGRRVQFRRMTFDDMLTHTEESTGGGGAPGVAQADMTPRFGGDDGQIKLKSQEELLAMPHEHHWLLGDVVKSEHMNR